MLKKVADFVENHAGVINTGISAIAMGGMIIMYKKFLKDLADD